MICLRGNEALIKIVRSYVTTQNLIRSKQRKGNKKQIKNAGNSSNFLHFLVEATGFEPTTFASRTQRATNCATPRFGFFRKWSNMWSNHSFRDFFIKLYWRNCQVFQGFQRFAKLANFYSVICSRTQRATNCATPRF